jgi:hypothetical protein
VSPICHGYPTTSGRDVQLTTSRQFFYLDLTGQQLQSFSGGTATGLVYLGLSHNHQLQNLSAEVFSGLESLQYLVISENGRTTEQYNAFLSGFSEQSLLSGGSLYATPYQYGGCNISNHEAGKKGKKLISDKGRTVIDAGLANCPAPVPPTPAPFNG